MTQVNKVIDKAVAMCNPQNDSALAVRMHVSRSAVSLWRKGGAISEKHLTALITLADVDAATAIAVLAEQAETKPQKAVWGELARRLSATAAIALCVMATTLPGAAKAAAISFQAEASSAGMYIM